jgi:hypothetical protein
MRAPQALAPRSTFCFAIGRPLQWSRWSGDLLRPGAYDRGNAQLEFLNGFDLGAVASFLNSFSNVFDVLLDLINLRMHVPNHFVLYLRKLFNPLGHSM